MPKRRRDEDSDSSDSDDDSSTEEQQQPLATTLTETTMPQLPKKYAYNNKQRVLVIASRGITARYRHLVEDLKKLVPHHKTDSKLDDKGDVQAVNEIAEFKSCNQILYLETRKHSDLYMYIGRTPNGPSAKFQVVNVHTMDELKLTGNCMLGSRPLLDFDSSFDRAPHLQLMKAMLTDTFGTPLGHPKSKPFLDRVMCFYLVKNNICKLSCAWLCRWHVEKAESLMCTGVSVCHRGPQLPNRGLERNDEGKGDDAGRDRSSLRVDSDPHLHGLAGRPHLVPEHVVRVSEHGTLHREEGEGVRWCSRGSCRRAVV